MRGRRRPWVRTRNLKTPFSADAQRVEAPPVELERHAAPLVEHVVAPEGSGCPGRATGRPPRRPSPRRPSRQRGAPREGGRQPSRPRVAAAPTSAATWSFMSCAPRPRISPSTTSPAHGSKLHSDGSAGTVSTWPSRHRVGPGLSPFRRATRLGRPSSAARNSHSKPASVSVSASSSCAGCSLPGGLTVLIRSSRCSRSTASEPSAVATAPSPSTFGRLMRCRPRRSKRVGLRVILDSSSGFSTPGRSRGTGPACRRARRRFRSGRGRARSTSSWARSTCWAEGSAATGGGRDGRAPLGDLLRPARVRQDDAGANHRRCRQREHSRRSRPSTPAGPRSGR